MRILLVTETLAVGGAETFVLRLARKLRQLGQQCEVLCLNRDLADARLVEQFAEVPVRMVPVPAIRWVKRADRLLKLAGIDWSIQLAWSLRWAQRQVAGRYDLYHGHLFGADHLLARLKQRAPGMRIVSTIHGDYLIYESGPQQTERNGVLNWRAKVRQITSAVDRWVYISGPQRDLFERLFDVPEQRLVSIYNGFEAASPPHRGTSPDGVVTFAMAARAMPEKGWGFLIEAFTRLEGRARLLLIGEGDHLDRLQAQYDDAKIAFLGFHPNPPDIISKAQVFVFPTIYQAESLPTVIVEALYCGVPVIATNLSEIPRMLRAEDGTLAGQLIPAEPVAEIVPALAAAMQRYLDDPALLARHAAAAPSAFAKFDMDQCARRYLRLYEEVAA